MSTETQDSRRMPANTTIYYPRPGRAAELRRMGNDVVEIDKGDMLLVNQTGSPFTQEKLNAIATKRGY
jgi:hypothetical protein